MGRRVVPVLGHNGSVGAPTTTTLNVVTNWFEVLKAKVGN